MQLLKCFTLLFLTVCMTAAVNAQPSPQTASQDSTPRVSQSTAPAAEDWNTLSIRGFKLGPAYANVVEHDSGPKYTRDVVRVQWRPGDPIDLYIYLPHGVAKAPAILYLYSYPSDVDRFYSPAWAERATANGFAAIGFVSALTGERYGNRPMKEWFVSELPEALAASTHDVQMILDYLASRDDIDMERIGMFGQGSGGAIAVLAAQADARIKTLDLMDPWGDWPEWLKESQQIPEEERAAYLKPEFLEKAAALDPVTYLPHLHVHSLRIQQILNDPATPRSAMDRIAAAALHAQDVVRFDNATEHFDAMHVAGVSGWLKGQLGELTPIPQAAAGIKLELPDSSSR